MCFLNWLLTNFYFVQLKDYLECSQHKILLEWFSWIDLQNGQQVHLVALRRQLLFFACIF